MFLYPSVFIFIRVLVLREYLKKKESLTGSLSLHDKREGKKGLSQQLKCLWYEDLVVPGCGHVPRMLDFHPMTLVVAAVAPD